MFLPQLLPVADWLRARVVVAVLCVLAGGIGLAQGGVVDAIIGAVVAGLAIGLSHVFLGQAAATSDRVSGGLNMLDTAALTVILATSGGASNPLVSLYLVPVLVAALLLPGRWVWATYAATGLAYGSLFALAPGAHLGHPGMESHLTGMFAVHAATGPVVALALLQARRAAARAEDQERAARNLEARTERLTALATLAAGASHELATPLSTILVVTRELERRTTDAEDLEDLVLVREEVQRCRDILHQLSADAGQGMGETPTPVVLQALLTETAGTDPRITVSAPEGRVLLPQRLVGQALRRMLGNARDASRPDDPITLTAQRHAQEVVFTVQDQGTGMDATVMDRAAEPFFTTKPVGEGSGLGLYFVHSVANRLGGKLCLVSTPGEGTTASLHLPTPPPKEVST